MSSARHGRGGGEHVGGPFAKQLKRHARHAPRAHVTGVHTHTTVPGTKSQSHSSIAQRLLSTPPRGRYPGGLTQTLRHVHDPIAEGEERRASFFASSATNLLVLAPGRQVRQTTSPHCNRIALSMLGACDHASHGPNLRTKPPTKPLRSFPRNEATWGAHLCARSQHP